MVSRAAFRVHGAHIKLQAFPFDPEVAGSEMRGGQVSTGAVATMESGRSLSHHTSTQVWPPDRWTSKSWMGMRWPQHAGTRAQIEDTAVGCWRVLLRPEHLCDGGEQLQDVKRSAATAAFGISPSKLASRPSPSFAVHLGQAGLLGGRLGPAAAQLERAVSRVRAEPSQEPSPFRC